MVLVRTGIQLTHEPTQRVLRAALRQGRHVEFARAAMTHPSIHARTHPDKIAYKMAGTGKAITYRELDELSNQGAHLFRKLGLKAGDHIALLMENRLAFMEICWAAQRARALLHRDQPLSDAGRDRLHRQGLRRESLHHHAEMPRAGQRPGRPARRAAALHDGRAGAGLPLLRQGSDRAADHADRGRGRGLRHALFVRHHRPAEGHQAAVRGQPDRPAESVPAASSAPPCAA